MITSRAIRAARQFDHLYVQVMREQRKRNPDSQRIDQLRREAVKVSTRLRRLMGW